MTESQGCEEAIGVCSWESPWEVETVFPRVGGLLRVWSSPRGCGISQDGEGVPAARGVGGKAVLGVWR